MAAVVATPVANGTNRRKSGRAVHAPAIFSQEQHRGSVGDSAKRKRPAEVANGDDDMDDDDDDEEQTESEVEDEDEPDEEEMKEKRRNQRSKQAKQPVAKPATKRPKTMTGASTTLAIRSANTKPKTVSKAAKNKARTRQSQFHETGLYGDVFGKGLGAEEAANSWYKSFDANNVAGVRDLVNLVLQVAGCDARIEDQDVEDVDNIPNKLEDVLLEYQEQRAGDYPLSGKQKQYHGMKEVFSDFFRAVGHALHDTGIMYEELAIYENIHTWLGTISGSGYRSFRHTATTASLALNTGLVEVAKEIRASIAGTKVQIDAERKKKSANKGRLAKLQEEMSAEENKLEKIEDQLKDQFNTVYVHRYRDPEEKIRHECVAAMGSWILKYRIFYLEGAYLRYLGWVMADPHAPTRLEVIRQLKAIYGVKNNLPALRGFTDRFRSRIVEMASRDADLTVRVEAVDLLNRLRSVELLNPEDIDTIGQLIFDNEPRVRKALAQFFVSNIEDLYSASIEDFDQAEFDEALPDADKVDDFDEPSKLWIKFKCLAQTLGAQTRSASTSSNKHLINFEEDQVDSRYMIATQSIFTSMPELQHWEALAGDLLHDHSNIKTTKNSSDLASAVQEAYKLDDGEDVILLDVLFCSVKLYLQPPSDNKQKPKTAKELKQLRETTAHNLSVFIPQLHSKFGSIPQAAKSILRLHQFFDPDLVDDLDEDDEQDPLLEDVSKQFTTQNDPEVLAEASRALRAALGHESSKEAASRKIKELWQDLTTQTLSPLVSGQNIAARGTLDRNKTRQLADVVGRLAQLASVKDCCEIIENKMSWAASKSKRKSSDSVLDILLQLVKRGEPDEDTPREAALLEDETCKSAIRTLSVYYRWKILNLRNAITAYNKPELSVGALTKLAMSKNDFVETLMDVISPRKPLDSVRIMALEELMAIFVIFATIRHVRPSEGELDEDIEANLKSLTTEVTSTAMEAFIETHEKMEKRLGRKTKKKNIELPLQKARKAEGRSRRDSAAVNDHDADDDDVDRPPEDSDEEVDRQDKNSDGELSSDDGDDIDSSVDGGIPSKDAKQKVALSAEKALCDFTAKIVLAILAQVVPKANDVKARLQVNRTKLGKSYTQVIAFLDEKKEKRPAVKSRGAPGVKTPVKTPVKGAAKKAVVSEALVLSDDDIEDSGDEQLEEGDPDALRDQGLEDDPIEEEGGDEEQDVDGADKDADGDDLMGD